MILRAIGYKDDPPLVAFTNFCWNISCKRPGIDAEFLRTALQLAGYQAEVMHTDQPLPETIEMIATGKADISVHTIRQTIERMKIIDFSIPINYLAYGYLAREVEEFQVVDYILRVLSASVYAFLFGSIILSGCLMFLLSRRDGDERLSEWIWHSMKVLLKQPSRRNRRNTGTAVFMIIWTWFCFTFTLYYESSMKSFLTLSSKKGYIFQTLEEVIYAVENMGWTIVTQERGWDPFLYCEGNMDQCDRLRKLEPRFVRLRRNQSMDDVVARPRMVAFIGLPLDRTLYDVSIWDKKRKLLFIRDTGLAQEMLAFAINKNHTNVRNRLNAAITQMGSSYENFSNRYTASLLPYRRHDSAYLFYTLPLVYAMPLFKVAFFMIGLSIFTLLLEFLFHRFHITTRVMSEIDMFVGKMKRISGKRKSYTLEQTNF